MSVDIEPFELSFRRPFTNEVSETLKIKNPNTTPVAFKVKTTAPKQYCVRPNSGRVEPGHDVEVTVLLQAMKQEPPADAKCRDKFLVQSVSITSDKEFANVASILDTADKSLVQERKIRVNWLAEELGQESGLAGAVTPNKKPLVNGNNDTPDVPRTYSSPGEQPSSTAPPPYSVESADTKYAGAEPEKSAAAAAAEKSTVAAAKTTVVETAQATYEQLKTRVSQLEAELKAKDGGGLRFRGKGGEGGESASAQVTQAVRQAAESTGGVSVQIVAVLCFLSFLLAYFFF